MIEDNSGTAEETREQAGEEEKRSSLSRLNRNRVLAKTLAMVQAANEAKIVRSFEDADFSKLLFDNEAYEQQLKTSRASHGFVSSGEETLESKAKRLNIRPFRLERWNQMKPLIRQGLTQQQIAEQFHISPEMVKKDFQDMRKKGEFHSSE